MLASPDTDKVKIDLIAVCHDCKLQHRITVSPTHFGDEAFGWHLKHEAHNFEFLTPKRIIPPRFDDSMFDRAGMAPWYLEYRHNTNLKLEYATLTAATISLASLGSSAGPPAFVAGREATAIVNSSNKMIDYRLSAKITTGTSPSVNTEVRLYVIGTLNDSPTWPDTFTGSDAAVTVTNAQIVEQFALSGRTLVSNTSNIGYPFNKCFTVAKCLGVVPKNWTIYVTQNTGAALHATGGNHEINYQGIYFTSI